MIMQFNFISLGPFNSKLDPHEKRKIQNPRPLLCLGEEKIKNPGFEPFGEYWEDVKALFCSIRENWGEWIEEYLLFTRSVHGTQIRGGCPNTAHASIPLAFTSTPEFYSSLEPLLADNNQCFCALLFSYASFVVFPYFFFPLFLLQPYIVFSSVFYAMMYNYFNKFNILYN